MLSGHLPEIRPASRQYLERIHDSVPKQYVKLHQKIEVGTATFWCSGTTYFQNTGKNFARSFFLGRGPLNPDKAF